MKVFAFDIGIASIGWAFIEDSILKDCGVRIFTIAENPKTGASLALPRREARSARKRLSRRSGRLNTIKQLLCAKFDLNLGDYLSNDGVLPKAYTTTKSNPLKSPYELRTLALTQKLDSKDLVRAILHIAKHRGYGNKHAKTSKDAESGKVKKAIEANRKILEEQTKKYASVGEYLYKEYFEKNRIGKNSNILEFKNVRNKKENYEHCMAQDLLEAELKLIFKKQKEFGVEIPEELETKLLTKIFEQRPLKSFEDKVGECQFVTGEKRAAKDSLSAMEFVALTRIINTLENLTKQSGEIYSKDKVLEILGLVLEKGEMSYAKLRSLIGLNDDLHFRDSKLNYTKGFKDAEKAKFIEFKHLKEFKKALGGSFQELTREQLDTIMQEIALTKDRLKLQEKLESYPLTEQQREALSNLNFSQHINLSLKALGKILPFMRGEVEDRCLRYDEAVQRAGLSVIANANQKSDFLPPLLEYEPYLANPVVKRALAEYRKVLNALLKKYGKVHKIHIEFAREVGLNHEERENYKKEQNENFAANEAARKKCEEIGLEPNGKNILKMKLWIEQGEFCVYSGNKITIPDLLEDKALQIDHIYPYSRSFDDSYMNKVLVLTKANQDKRERTPFEAFGSNSEKWNKVLELCKKLPKKKFHRILNTNFKDKEAGFKQRNLNDTRYIARLVASYTDAYIEFLPLNKNEDTTLGAGEKGSRRHISVVSGSLTSVMRHHWGLGYKDRNHHLHHAVDAVIIGFLNDSIIKAFSDFKKTQEQNTAEYYAKKISKERFKNARKFFTPKLADGSNFRENVLKKIDSIFVSKPPRKMARGALHEASFYSLNDKDLLKSYGGIQGVERAIELGKIRQVGTKIVSNGTMIRVDIFKDKKGKFYGVPLYTMDFALGVLPNKAVVAGKDNDGVIKDWLTMDSNYEFVFSLYKDDLLLLQRKEMEKPELCYFESFDVSSASIQVGKDNNRFATLTENQKLLFSKATEKEVKQKGIGIQNLKVFEKWQVSVLGEVKKADFHPREELHRFKKS